MDEPPKSVIEQVESYYTEKIEAFGPTPRGVDWRDEQSQDLRFAVLLRILDGVEGWDLLDFGCGYGALLDHPSIGAHHVKYMGTDVSPAMVKAATRLHEVCGIEHRDFRFSLGAQIEDEHDAVVASGIFNVKMGISEDDWQRYIDQTVMLLAARSRHSFAYNCLSDQSDPERRRDDLHYANAMEHAERVMALGFEAEIVEGYGLYEFTILGRR